MDRGKRSVIFAVAGKGKETIKSFSKDLRHHGGCPSNIVLAVCDMSKAFISGITRKFSDAEIVVDWFHVIKLFNDAVDKVRRKERRYCAMPSGLRWAVLKGADGRTLSQRQKELLCELINYAKETVKAWRIKEMLRWINRATTFQGAKWRLSVFLRGAEDNDILSPVKKAIQAIKNHKDRIIARWNNNYTTSLLESLNGLFQAVRIRARGYRNVYTFITMIYLIGTPIKHLLKST